MRCTQAAVKYNRQMVQADQPQAAFTLRARIKRTESSCTTNHLRVCVRLVACFHVLGFCPDRQGIIA